MNFSIQAKYKTKILLLKITQLIEEWQEVLQLKDALVHEISFSVLSWVNYEEKHSALQISVGEMG